MQTIRRALDRLLDPKNTGATLPCNGPHENHHQSKSIFPIPSTTYRHTPLNSRQTHATLAVAGRQFPIRKSAASSISKEKIQMSTVVQIEANSTATQGKTRSTYLSQAVLLTAVEDGVGTIVTAYFIVCLKRAPLDQISKVTNCALHCCYLKTHG